MLRGLVVMLGAVMLLAMAPLASDAHTVSLPTKTSRAKLPRGDLNRGQRVIIFGKVSADDATCFAGVTVSLQRRVPGADRVLETKLTNPDGEYWFLRRARGDQRLYVLFPGFVDVSSGHSHTCGGSVSREVLLNVVK